MATFLVNLLKSQYLVTLPVPETSFTGKTVIVTGANVGLGLEAARHIHGLDAAKVIIACRSIEKGEAAKKDILSSTEKAGIIEVWQLDLSSYASVKAFAERAEQLERLDVLLENAGVSTTNYAITEKDESTITTNVVSTFLLALLLLPKLKETASTFSTLPHLTIVSSEVHALTDLPERNAKSSSIFSTLSDKETCKMSNRYETSKLLEVLAIRALVPNHAPPGYPIVINYVNPGFCHSQLMREMSVVSSVMKVVLHARTTEAGSRTLVHAVTAGKESHGEYMSDCAVAEPSPFVRSAGGKKTAERVWEELSGKLEGIQPGILERF